MSPAIKAGYFPVLLIVTILVCAAYSVSFSGQSSGHKPDEKSVLDRFSEDQRKKLEAGEAVFEYVLEDSDESMKGYGRTSILIKKPINLCFKIFLDFERQYEYLPHMTVSRVLESQGNRVIIYKELDYTITTIKYTHILTIHPGEHRVEFQDAGDIYEPENRKGYFEFVRVDEDTTLFNYALEKLDTGFPVPEFIKRYVTSRDLPGIAVSIKTRIESGGEWKK
jgi:hypothetical protein